MLQSHAILNRRFTSQCSCICNVVEVGGRIINEQ